ncbi:MAG: MBL fold metallo-hydrolase [Verrucomicrobiota bacterium]|nr:MBL fold metallo-hydrolase [Verrucomicrobiota bacterium]
MSSAFTSKQHPLKLEAQFGGVCLPGLSLWLDPQRQAPEDSHVFVSHAHSDHIARHKRFIATTATALFLKTRLRTTFVPEQFDFFVPRSFNAGSCSFRITPLPAGHVLGSAMALLETDAGRLLYTGDFKLKPCPIAEHCDFSPAKHCDVLIMETTYGLPQYVFPPEDEVHAQIASFCKETLAANATPVLLASSLGKSQKLILGLARFGLPIMVHNTIHALNKIYQQMGFALPHCEVFDPDQLRGKVLICPPTAARRIAALCTTELRLAVASGWALDPRYRFRLGVHAGFPLSNHADYSELVRLVECLEPRLIVTLHGFATEFARTLRAAGWNAQTLSVPEQLDLPLRISAN